MTPAIYAQYKEIVYVALTSAKLQLNKSKRKFMLEIFLLYLSIPSRINFLQLGRFSRSGGQRFRRQFEEESDFFSFILSLCLPFTGSRCALAFDPSFVPKSGKHTSGIGYFRSGCVSKSLRGLEILGISLIDSYHTRFQMEFGFRGQAIHRTGKCTGKRQNSIFHFNTVQTAVNIAKVMQLKDGKRKELSFSMREYKTLFYNALMLSHFFDKFGISPNKPKNQQIFKELLLFDSMAA